MRLTLHIDLGNSAFEDETYAGRLIETLGARLEDQGISQDKKNNGALIYDYNGNRVGFWSVGK